MTTRREFLEIAAVTVMSANLAQSTSGETKNRIPYRTLGRTGEKVSAIGIGGYHLARPGLAAEEATRIVRTALDEGINFLDNCWDYNGGESEIRMGEALRDGYRQKAFLMTKIDGRDKATATNQINESLKRLETDRIDLLQFHEVIRDSDPDRIFATGGALEAVQQAQKAGKVRHIGFTGHKSPEIHLKMLSTAAAHHFTFDAVQMPLKRHGPSLQQFRNQGPSCFVEAKHRSLGNEANGRSFHSQKQNGNRSGVLALSLEPTDQRCDHRLRLDADSAASS